MMNETQKQEKTLTFAISQEVFDIQTGHRGYVVSVSEDGKTAKISTPYGREERPVEKLMAYVSVQELALRDMAKNDYWTSRFEGLDKQELAEIAEAAEIYRRYSDVFEGLNQTQIELMSQAAKRLSK